MPEETTYGRQTGESRSPAANIDEGRVYRTDVDENGQEINQRLTRYGMEAQHKRGISVLYKGRIIPPGGTLPDEDELANTPSEAKDASDDLRNQIAALNARLDKLTVKKPEAPKSPPK